MSFVPEVPGHAPVVVRTKRNTTALYAMLLAVTALLVALLVAQLAASVWLGTALFLLLAPPLALQLYFTVLVVREYQGLLGPQLAADHTGLWVRTGLGRRPEAVYLPWHAVDGVDTARGPVVRIMSRQGEALFPTRAHWRVRSLRRRFGTAFVVDGRRSAEPVEQIAHRLVSVAGTRPPAQGVDGGLR
ncbi:hypothetical protein [Actinophytocola sp. NPDC049390]|uniref:hypothetical protein n=1 Tax=Actinophytocola sp. NPDC049390 TaxID=3363894 RepID=UPI0037B1FA4B